MAYQDYDWQCAGLPFRWVVAELYAVLLLGLGWGIALWASLAYFFEPVGPWAGFSLVMLMWYGVHLALPEGRDA